MRNRITAILRKGGRFVDVCRAEGISNACRRAYNKLFAKNAEVVNMFFNDIDFKQIAEDYQTQFLPKYKECLKRLYERAQELQKENADRKKEIEKEKIELAQSDENLEKLKTKLQDLTKGR